MNIKYDQNCTAIRIKYSFSELKLNQNNKINIGDKLLLSIQKIVS